MRRALMCALDLASMPALAAQARQQALPEGVLDVIRIAAGCKETLDEAARRSGKDPRFIKSAAEFYIQQVLLFPAADSHRILGVQPNASREQMRTHMRWLMLWLHPDHAQADWQAAFARRVLAAWREAGNAPLRGGAPAFAEPKRQELFLRRIPWVPRPIETRRRTFSRPSLLLAVTLVAITLMTASGLVEAAASWVAALPLAAFETFFPGLPRDHDPAPPGSPTRMGMID